jgi:cyclopropane fatty-acyl-phospholipid synthase-like methyltransferase
MDTKPPHKKSIDLDKIYREVPLDKIPWNSEIPPPAIVELVENARILPCRALDMGCGAGNQAIYLAGRGFEMTGIDISTTAITLAQNKATQVGVECLFLAADVLGDLDEIPGTFDFIFDWQLLHHIFPEDRTKYAENVDRLLRSGGKHLSCCFSEQDPQFGGQGKYRSTSMGTVLYFSSEQEIKELFEPHFHIEELKILEFPGKFDSHRSVYAFMSKP